MLKESLKSLRTFSDPHLSDSGQANPVCLLVICHFEIAKVVTVVPFLCINGRDEMVLHPAPKTGNIFDLKYYPTS